MGAEVWGGSMSWRGGVQPSQNHLEGETKDGREERSQGDTDCTRFYLCEHGHENLPVWFRSLRFLFRFQVRGVNVRPKQPSFPLMFTLFSTFSSVVYILIKFDIFCVREVISSVPHSKETQAAELITAPASRHAFEWLEIIFISDAEHVQVVHFQICLFLSFIALHIFFDCVSKRPTGGGGGETWKRMLNSRSLWPSGFTLMCGENGSWNQKLEYI